MQSKEQVITKKKKKPWWITPAALGASGYGVLRATDWLVPATSAQEFKEFSDTMRGVYGEYGADGKNIEWPQTSEIMSKLPVDRAYRYGLDYGTQASNALNSKIFGNKLPADFILKARAKAPEIYSRWKDTLSKVPVVGDTITNALADVAKYPLNESTAGGQADIRHYLDMSRGPLSAARHQMTEYGMDMGYGSGGFGDLVQRRALELGLQPKSDNTPIISNETRDRVISRLREYVDEKLPHGHLLPVDITNIPRDKQLDLLNNFSTWLDSKGYTDDQKAYKAIMAGIGDYRGQGASLTYARHADLAKNIRRGGLILSGLLAAAGGGIAAKKLYDKYQTRKKRLEKEKELNNKKSASLTYADVIEAGKVVPKNISLKRRLSGRYPKGRVVWNGMAINIETPAGHWRMGKKSDGKLWLSKMNYAYGHIARRPGYDGDPIDVFLGPHLDSPVVFVINQSKMTDNKFDEHKVMIGWYTEVEARNAYKSHFKKVNAPYMSCVKMTIDQFKSWLPSAKKGPATKQADLSFISPVLVGLAGVGSDMAANALARRNADRAAKILGVMTPKQKAYFDSQIKQPAVKVPGLQSPAYISQRDIENALNLPVTNDRGPRRGTVVYDPFTTPAAYYAHELAHKDTPRWAQYDRFTPKQLAVANVSSYLPGVITGAVTGKPILGAVTGAVSRLVGRSPVLLEEYLAMRRAKQLVDYMPGTEDEKNKQKTALTKAFLTYLLPPAVGGAVSGGAAGLARRYA